MGRRLAKMIDLSTSLAAFRHSALLIAESILVEKDPTMRNQDRLDRLRSTTERLEIALEMERRLGSVRVIAPNVRNLDEARSAPRRAQR